MIEKPRDMPPFTDEQLGYLKNLLAIEPCHITGTHEPDHHLKGIICNYQRGEAWERAMVALGLDPKNPARKVHDDCFWCHEYEKTAPKHQEWAALGPNYRNPALFRVTVIIPKPGLADAPSVAGGRDGSWARESDRAIFAHKDIINKWSGDETLLDDSSMIVKTFYGNAEERGLEANGYAASVTQFLGSRGFTVKHSRSKVEKIGTARVIVEREY